MGARAIEGIAFPRPYKFTGLGEYFWRNQYGAQAGLLPLPENAPEFILNLKKSIVPEEGTGGPTYTRATTAYVTDFEGLLKQVPSGCARFTGARMVRNWLTTTSENFSNAAWTKDATTTVTAGQTDPIGGTTAYKIENVTAADGVYNLCTGFPTTAGNTFTASIWIKGAVGGEVVNLGYLNTTATVTASTSWQRMSVTALTNDIYFRIRPQGANSTIYVWRALGEDVTGQTITAPSEYVSVGVLSAPYHGAGADGVKYFDTENGNTVASNVVTEAPGAAIPDATLKGYLAEGARQNRCLYSQDFSNAAWVATSITKGSTVAAPDGSTTAMTLTASGANGTLLQTLTAVSAAKAFSIWMKRRTGTGTIQMTMDNGVGWTTKTITSSWARYTVTQTVANEVCGIRIVTSGDAIDVWGAQVETGTGESTYIPTTSGAVTRNADVLNYSATYSTLIDAAGSAYVEVSVNNASGSGVIDVEGDGGTGPIYWGTASAIITSMYDGTTAASPAAGSPSVSFGTPYKVASSWGAGKMRISQELYGIGADANFDGSWSPGSSAAGLWLGGGNGGANPHFGTIRNVRLWTFALSREKLSAITA